MTSNLYIAHTRRCFAQSMISAIENARDTEAISSSVEFQRAMLSGSPFTDAVDYLNTGLQDCRCSEQPIEHIKVTFDVAGPQPATDLASRYLAEHRINSSDYIQLIRWSEGRPSDLPNNR